MRDEGPVRLGFILDSTGCLQTVLKGKWVDAQNPQRLKASGASCVLFIQMGASSPVCALALICAASSVRVNLVESSEGKSTERTVHAGFAIQIEWARSSIYLGKRLLLAVGSGF